MKNADQFHAPAVYTQLLTGKGIGRDPETVWTA